MSENDALDGGGLYCVNSNPELINVTINNNEAGGNESKGGGIFCSTNSTPTLEYVDISDNSAINGGGIYCSSSNIAFSETNRCNIYFNGAVRGNDLYSDTIMEVVVDTFSVLYPHDYYAEQFGNFTFDILNGKIEQVNSDLYISQYGSNSNSGLNTYNALKTLNYAFSIIRADSLNPRVFYLLNGTYSSLINGETMPVNVVDYINIVGESENNVILDGENMSTVLEYHDNHSSAISNVKINNGNGYGILMNGCDLVMNNITISNNSSHGIYGQNSNLVVDDISVLLNGAGGVFCENTSMNIANATILQNGEQGIYCYIGDTLILENSLIIGNADRGLLMYSIEYSTIKNVLIKENTGGGIRLSFSNPIINEVIISDNSAIDGGGLYCSNLSNPYLENVFIINNSVSERGGGGYCNYTSNPIFVNTQITGNTADDNGGGIACIADCEPAFINVTIADNTSNDIGGAIYSYASSTPTIVNSVLWNNAPQEVFANNIELLFSDIQGGWEGEGNIDEDPLFVGAVVYPYALSEISPCVNDGNPDTTGLNLPEFDLAGNQRYRGGRIDMGAYENQNVNTSIDLKPITNTFNLSCSPNPFTNELTVNWNQTKSDFTKIEIYSPTNKKIKELVSEVLPAGNHEFHWKNNELTSGIYYIRFQTSIINTTRKVVKY